MGSEPRASIVARLAEIGHERSRIKDLAPAERFHAAKKLRVERQRLNHELASRDCLRNDKAT